MKKTLISPQPPRETNGDSDGGQKATPHEANHKNKTEIKRNEPGTIPSSLL